MSFSFSAVDAELRELCPTELDALIARLSFAPLGLPLSEVDALLAALGEPVMRDSSRELSRDLSRVAPDNDVGPLPSRRPSVMPPRAALPSMPRGSTPSIPRGSLPSPNAPLPPTRRDLSPVRAAARQSVVAAAGPEPHSEESFVRAPAPGTELGVAAAGAPTSHAASLRDADAEFDALLADATSPQGLPVRKLLDTAPGSSGAQRPALGEDAAVIDAVVGEPRAGQSGAFSALSQASDDTSIDVSLDGDDATEVFDQQTFDAIQARSLPPAAGEEEVDLSEFELEFDALTESDTEQGVHKPPPVPGAARGSSPTEQTPADKRPSFLGRLFHRRDGESE